VRKKRAESRTARLLCGLGREVDDDFDSLLVEQALD
jgi:hypothetical protein